MKLHVFAAKQKAITYQDLGTFNHMTMSRFRIDSTEMYDVT